MLITLREWHLADRLIYSIPILTEYAMKEAIELHCLSNASKGYITNLDHKLGSTIIIISNIYFILSCCKSN